MSFSRRIRLTHRTHYHYDRPVRLGPQLLRLKPAPYGRALIESYDLRVSPCDYPLHWQSDVFGDFLARAVFPRPLQEWVIEVEFTAILPPVNPFNFLLDHDVARFPFAYEAALKRELLPFLAPDEAGPRLLSLAKTFRGDQAETVPLVMDVARQAAALIAYRVRDEEGILECEQLLEEGEGSCRDSAWLLVQLYRHLGIAARFVSGYLIELDAANATGVMRHELHAWAEVYLPGAGWVGLDGTSGLVTGEGHIPLAVAATPERAAPVSGRLESCRSTLEYRVEVERLPASS